MHKGRKCTAPTELPHTGPGDAPKGALPGLDRGVNAFLFGVSCCQSVKIREGLLEMHGFQCIGGGKCTAPTELSYAGLGDVPKVRLPGLGKGVNAFLCSVSCWQSVKIRKELLKMHGFQCIGGRSVLAQMSCKTLGRAMPQKTRPLALQRGACIFSILFLVCSVWENALHGYNSGGNAV